MKRPFDVIADIFSALPPTPLEQSIVLILLGEHVDENILREARKEALERNIFVKDTPLSEAEKQKRIARYQAQLLLRASTSNITKAINSRIKTAAEGRRLREQSEQSEL
jgi:hypothetical protein